MKYNCPVCQVEMQEQAGSFLYPGDPKFGVTLFCRNVGCSAQEVAGHGDNVKDAWKVVQEKFITRTERES